MKISRDLQRADKLYKQGRLAKSGDLYKRVLTIDPLNHKAIFGMGQVFEALASQAEKGEETKRDEIRKAAVLFYSKAAGINRDKRYILKLGAALYKLGQVKEAAQLFEELGIKKQDDMIGLGLVQYEAGYALKAIDTLREVEKKWPGSDLSLYFGNCFLAIGNFDEALRHYSDALKRNKNLIEAICGKAIIYEKRKEFHKAKRILSKHLNNHAVALAYADVAYSLDIPETAVEPLLKLLADPTQGRNNRRRAHFLLGKIYDRVGEYQNALYHYTKGNKLKGEIYDHDKRVYGIDLLISKFTKESLSFANRATNKERFVFIVGLPRSGSTLIEQILSSHPDVYGAGEAVWMDQIADRFDINASVEDMDKLANEYIQHVRMESQAQVVVDKKLFNYHFIGMIQCLFPNAKVINCRRDWRDQRLSIYFQDFAGHHSYAYDLDNIDQYRKEYERMMAHWHSIGIPILDFQYEDLVDDQEGMTRKLLDYCGLNFHEDCMRFYQNKRIVMTASNQQVDKKLYSSSVGRWRNYANSQS